MTYASETTQSAGKMLLDCSLKKPVYGVKQFAHCSLNASLQLALLRCLPINHIGSPVPKLLPMLAKEYRDLIVGNSTISTVYERMRNFTEENSTAIHEGKRGMVPIEQNPLIAPASRELDVACPRQCHA